MPHCIIEYAKDIVTSEDKLVESVAQGAMRSGLFEADTIKTRAMPFSAFKVGQTQIDFIHVTSRILSGRTLEQKRHLNQCIQDALSELAISKCSVTTEVVDMDKASYLKTIY